MIVVSGTATVTIEKEVVQLDAGQQVLIPKGAVHRLENRTGETVELIEVQIGAYLGDDDIVRIDDQCGRTLAPAAPLKTAA